MTNDMRRPFYRDRAHAEQTPFIAVWPGDSYSGHRTRLNRERVEHEAGRPLYRVNVRLK